MGSGERGMNPVAMTILNPRAEFWPSPRIDPATSCSQACMLPAELWGSANHDVERYVDMQKI